MGEGQSKKRRAGERGIVKYPDPLSSNSALHPSVAEKPGSGYRINTKPVPARATCVKTELREGCGQICLRK